MSLLSAVAGVLPIFISLGVMIGFLGWARHLRLVGRRSPLTQGLLRPAGHQLREEIEDLGPEFMGWFMAGLLLPGFVGVWMAAQLRSPGGALLVIGNAIAYSVLMVGILSVSTYKSGKLLQRILTLRMALDAEMAAGQELDQLMRKGAVVFHDFPANDFNIDHVLICTAGVYAIETKSRLKPARGGAESARVNCDGVSLAFPGWTETEPIEQAQRQAKWLSQELARAVGEAVHVFAVLALPGWYVSESRRGAVRVLNPRNFHFLLEEKRPALTPKQIQQIAYQVEQRCRDIRPVHKSAA
jgi:hypothetical protein